MYASRGPVCDIHDVAVMKQLTDGAKDLAKKYFDMFSDDEPHYRNMTRDYFEETGFGVAFYKNESKNTIKVVCCNLFGTPK